MNVKLNFSQVERFLMDMLDSARRSSVTAGVSLVRPTVRKMCFLGYRQAN